MFATPEELGAMKSGDLGGTPVSDWRGEIEKHPDNVLANQMGNYRGSLNTKAYLDTMAAQVDKQGGVETPVHVWHDHDANPWLMDGHHRAQTAIETNRLVPVVHHGQWNKMEAVRSALNGKTRTPMKFDKV
jgi:hypothetical protein